MGVVHTKPNENIKIKGAAGEIPPPTKIMSNKKPTKNIKTLSADLPNASKTISKISSKKAESKNSPIDVQRPDEPVTDDVLLNQNEALPTTNVHQQITGFSKSNNLLCLEIKEILDEMHLTSDEKTMVDSYLAKVELDPYIMHIIPKCGDKTCLFKNLNCPFIAMNKQPFGKPCPLAMGLAMNLRDQWLEAISSRLTPQDNNNKDEYNSVRYDIVIYRLIVSLIETDLYDIMMDNEMSTNGLVDPEASCVVLRSGEITYIPGESASSIIHEKIQSRRDTILRQLLLTPEISAKYKLINKNVDSSDEDIDELKDRVNQRNKQIIEEKTNMEKAKNKYGTDGEYVTIYERVNTNDNSIKDENSSE